MFRAFVRSALRAARQCLPPRETDHWAGSLRADRKFRFRPACDSWSTPRMAVRSPANVDHSAWQWGGLDRRGLWSAEE